VVDATGPGGLALLGMSCASRLSFEPTASERVITSGVVVALCVVLADEDGQQIADGGSVAGRFGQR